MFAIFFLFNSIYDLCRRNGFSSYGLDFKFWTSLWTDKHAGLLGNLFINGLTYGNYDCNNHVEGSMILVLSVVDCEK
jgi:hypothetical protein